MLKLLRKLERLFSVRNRDDADQSRQDQQRDLNKRIHANLLRDNPDGVGTTPIDAMAIGLANRMAGNFESQTGEYKKCLGGGIRRNVVQRAVEISAERFPLRGFDFQCCMPDAWVIYMWDSTTTRPWREYSDPDWWSWYMNKRISVPPYWRVPA